MGFNNIHNTNLVLGLGFGFSSTQDQTPSVKLDDQHGKRSGPSLTLTLSADHVYNFQPQDSSCASISLCNGKREKGVGGEEVERERIASPRACDEDDGASNGRKKLRLTKSQSTLLEESFKQHSTLNPKHKQELAKELKLRPRQVEVWFQNRRARTKLKQTEVDCKQLKKCYKTLTEENRRLQKELQQLKLQNFAPPLYKQFPAASVTMCPSCERIGGGATTTSATVVVVGDNGSKRLMLSMAPHVLTNPSAQLAS